MKVLKALTCKQTRESHFKISACHFVVMPLISKQKNHKPTVTVSHVDPHSIACTSIYKRDFLYCLLKIFSMFYAFNLTVTKFACLHLETFIKVNIPISIGCIISQFLLGRFSYSRWGNINISWYKCRTKCFFNLSSPAVRQSFNAGIAWLG